MSAPEAAEAAVQGPVCKFAEGCHRVVACTPGCGDRAVSLGTLRADAVLAGRAMSAAVFLAGLIANGQLMVVGSPDKLPQYMYPGVPEAQEIFQHGVAVGLNAGRRSADPDRYQEEMARNVELLEGAAFNVMGRLVGRSRRLVAPELTHPADSEAGRDRPSPV